MFRLLDEAAGILRKKRMERGAVDFDFAECKILLDEKGRPEALVPRERNAATMLIEDFMLAANETVAEDYYWQQIPFLYRTHEKPDEEKIRRFAILINKLTVTPFISETGRSIPRRSRSCSPGQRERQRRPCSPGLPCGP